MSIFTVARSVAIDAPAERVVPLVASLRSWQLWSPWEDLDPDLVRDYSGPESGVGSRYAWSGNRKAGRGTMEVTAADPGEVRIALEFLKPWRASNTARFIFEAMPGGTAVTWEMTGAQTGLARIFALAVGMDRLVGKDFERGLAALKTAAEQD